MENNQPTLQQMMLHVCLCEKINYEKETSLVITLNNAVRQAEAYAAQSTAPLQARVKTLEDMIDVQKLMDGMDIQMMQLREKNQEKENTDLREENETLWKRIEQLESDKQALHKVIVGHENTICDHDELNQKLMGLLEEQYKKNVQEAYRHIGIQEHVIENAWKSYCKEWIIK